MHVNDTPTLKISVGDGVTGAPLDPAVLDLTVTAPDGTQTVHAIGALTRLSEGSYAFVLPLASRGVWSYNAVGDPGNVVMGSGTILADVGPHDGVLQPWCTWDDVTQCSAIDLSALTSVIIKKVLIDRASEVLYDLTRRRYPGVGVITRSICKGPIVSAAWWSSSGCSSCGSAIPGCCAPNRDRAVDLGVVFPALSVQVVKEADVVLASSAYLIEKNRWLHRIDGNDWPSCSDASDPNANSVTFSYGRQPSVGGVHSAARLACENAKACLSLPCDIPKRITSITREGVSFAVIDSMKMIEDGRTGLYDVDQWVDAENRSRQARPGMFDPAAQDSLRAMPT